MEMTAHNAKNMAARLRFGPEWPILKGDEHGAPYSKTFDFPGSGATDFHAYLAHPPLGRSGVPFNIDLGIDGYLQIGDARKIYELAFFTPGDVLELGTHYGLSASIIARALHDRNRPGTLETIDIDSETTAKAKLNLATLPGSERISFTVKDAPVRMDELIAEGRKYGYIFIDHWHGYKATLDAASRVADLLADGGYVQFHDFLNPENIDPNHVYGVYQAVLDAICEDLRFSFAGLSGCTAVFKFTASNHDQSHKAA